MSTRTESRAFRVGGFIGQVLGILLAGAVLGIIGAWAALQIVGALRTLG
ncbi:MAG: hypothetical protein U1F31_01920 [Steroidobacteraceae bacterium]